VHSRRNEHGKGTRKSHWLIFDEPDVGLGKGYRIALGKLFAEFATDLPVNTSGFIVVTHAREVASAMIAVGASSVRVGDDLRPVSAWLRDGDLPKSIEDLEGLSKRSINRRRAVNAVLHPRTPKP